LVAGVKIRSVLLGFRSPARLTPVRNVLSSPTNDSCNQQREPKKNHGTRYSSEKKDLFGMMQSEGATEYFYIPHREAILHRDINPENSSHNYQY
jgi:hypothetical protein